MSKYEPKEIEGFTYERFKEDYPDDWKSYIVEDIFNMLYGFNVNLNDTFAYATAMTDYMCLDDWMDLEPLVIEYRDNAIRAYFSLKLGADVIEPLQSEEYFKCKRIIKHLKDNDDDLFSFFEYGEGFTK